MVNANDIKSAIELMDTKNDAQWEADGTPKLDILQGLTNNPELTLDDIDEAVGAFKRGQKVKLVEVASEKGKTGTVIGANDEGEGELPAPDLSKMDPNSPEYAGEVVRVARAEQARLTAFLVEQEAIRDAAVAEIKAITAKVDVQVVLIERYAPKISHAQAVKAIQAQTVKTLAQTQARMALATQALASTGQQLVFPSKLDQSLAMRKRTPEQNTNFAKYVHQTAAGRNAA